MSDNRCIRIFVSSTFNDMVEDRNELMTQAWPELRRFCRERQVELVEVDLRWGISEEQATRKETLKLCLDEIRACRPFFIGLLGERYGWTPGPDAFTADLQEEQPWLRGLAGKSITELEILHGVLNNPEMADRSFFYFRDPAYAQARGAQFLPESPAEADKQVALKETIRCACAVKEQASQKGFNDFMARVGFARTKKPTTQRIPVHENYVNPHELAALVLEDLKNTIVACFPIEEVPNTLTREARDHEAFAETRRRTYIGRPDYFARLDRHAAGDGGPLVLVGDSGSGKSALLANWIEHWREAHPKDFLFQHYVGGAPNSENHWRLMARLIAEIKRWTNDPKEPPISHEDLVHLFPVWLAKARNKAQRDGLRCILVLDAVNHLEDHDHALQLGWLPAHPFIGGLRLVVSTLPGTTMEAVEKRGWESLRVEPLRSDERRTMVEHYLARFGKKLDEVRLARLAAAQAAANPLYLKILLDELRVTGTHDRLDERLSEYLSSPDIPALFERMLERYRRDYERDRPGLVSDSLSFIFASRRGLSEMELLRLLGGEDLYDRPPLSSSQPHDPDHGLGEHDPLHVATTQAAAQLAPAIWSPFRAALDEWLVDHNGIMNFAHSFLRDAVEKAFLAAEGRIRFLRLRMANFFASEPVSERTSDELPWLLHQTNQQERLRACLLDIDRFQTISRRDVQELRSFWIGIGEETNLGKVYFDSFKEWLERQGDDRETVSRAAHELSGFLTASSLNKEAEILAGLAISIDEEVHGRGSPVVARGLSRLANTLLGRGRFDEAEPMIRRALSIDVKALGMKHPMVASDFNRLAAVFLGTNRFKDAEEANLASIAIYELNFGMDDPDLAMPLNNLAQMLKHSNRLNQAEPLMLRSRAILETTFGENDPEVAGSLNNLGQLYKELNRLAEAEALMRRALAIDERSFGKDHPHVARDLDNLALLLCKAGRLPEADPLLMRVVIILSSFIRTTGDASLRPHLKGAANNYCQLQVKLGRSKEEAMARIEEIAPGVLRESDTTGDEEKRKKALAATRDMASNLYSMGECTQARRGLAVLVHAGFELAETYCDLACIAMITDDISEAEQCATSAWNHIADAPAYVAPRVIWLWLAVDTLKHKSTKRDQLALMKKALPIKGVQMEWNLEPVLTHLREKLAPRDYRLLAALANALSDRSKLPDLEAFPEWRNARSV